MRLIIFSSEACLTLPHFSTLSLIKDSYNIFSETLLILKRIHQDIIIKYTHLHVKHKLFCQILMRLEFSQPIFEQNLEYQVSSKSTRSGVVPCGRTEERTDRQT
jgi:hypothetical protein